MQLRATQATHLLLQIVDILPVSSVLLLCVLTDGVWVGLWIPSNGNAEVISVLAPDVFNKVKRAGEAALYLDKAVLTLGRITPKG